MFHFYKKNNVLKFKINKLTFNNVLGGHCGIIPKCKYTHYKPFWTDFAGPLSNFVIGFILATIHTDGQTLFIRMLMYQLAYLNIVTCIFNLIPYKLFGQQTDGYNMLRGFYSIDRRSMYIFSTAHNEIIKGKRYRDFDDKLLLVETNEKTKNFWGTFLAIMYASHLTDKGEYDAAMKEYDRLNWKFLFDPYLRCVVKCEMLYYYLIYNFDAKKCKELYEDEELNTYLQQNTVISKRVLAAYTSIILDNKNKGEQLLQEAITLANSLEGGYKVMELDTIKGIKLNQGTI